MPSKADLAEKTKTFFRGFPRRALGGLGALINGWEDKLWSLLRVPGIPEKLSWLKGKLVPMLSALVLVPLLIIILALILPRGSARAGEGPAAVNFGPAPIPREDLFLREEPDFLPPVILERERRDAWTGDDAAPFWYNPLEDGEELWREQVEKVIDDLLERVP
jgi:hypothetical protein